MCGRYYLADARNMKERFNVKDVAEWLTSRYNIAPTQEVPAVIEDEGRRLVRFKWGLKPYWARDRALGSGLINARAETVDVKPSFKESFKRRRCLLPASGFFEWKKAGKKKVPFRIGLSNWELFAFAGLWSSWKTPEGETAATCAIITTPANALVARIHHRMPVILPREAEGLWLDPHTPDTDLLKELLKPYPEGQMAMHRVSTLVNSPGNDNPRLLEPVEN